MSNSDASALFGMAFLPIGHGMGRPTLRILSEFQGNGGSLFEDSLLASLTDPSHCGMSHRSQTIPSVDGMLPPNVLS